jgi:hypothetical protein
VKIFGLEITRHKPDEPQVQNKPIIQDVVPEIKLALPDTKGPATIPSVKDPTLNYAGNRFQGRGQFSTAEYDLSEMGRIEDTDSYVRQAFEKKEALMFKEGWDIVGKNPRTIKYLRARLAQISRASGNPTDKLWREIGSSLIRKSNAFIIKVRKTEASGGRVRVDANEKTLQPVAAYFIAPAETMEYQLSNNRITRWRQRMPDGSIQEYRPQDVIHFYFSRKDGFIFGTPSLVPVVDDIRALRKIEENIELLVYQHLFPLFQYKVGTKEAPAGFTETGEREIDMVRREIQYMPTEGGIVTPERHEIVAIGAEGRALRAESYLEHFKQRVFAGLGVSSVDMGDGQTANRSTADNMSRNLVDSVKNYQQITEIFINEFVLSELLLESTFGEDVLDEENRCYLKFKEIDIATLIKKEAHYADQFKKNIVTWAEARSRAGFEPINVPTPEEVAAGDDLHEEYPEWYQTHWKLFGEPTILMQSIDEPYSTAAQAAAANRSTSLSAPQVEQAGEKQNEQEIALEKEKTKAKIAVAKAKPKPKPARKDGFLNETFRSLREEVLLRSEQKFDPDWLATLIRTGMRPAIDRLITEQVTAFIQGYSRYGTLQGNSYINSITMARRHLSDRAEHYVERLTNELVGNLRRQSTNLSKDELLPRIRAIFDTLEYRTRFIEDVEVRKALNYGKLQALAPQMDAASSFHSTSTDTTCLQCQSHHRTTYSFANIALDHIAPHHANCHCKTIVTKDSKDNGVFHSIIDSKFSTQSDNEGYLPEKLSHDCPKCNKTALKSAQVPNTYWCIGCREAFTVEDSQDNANLNK